MMRLIMRVNEYDDQHTISQYVGDRQPMFDTMNDLDNKWPGVLSHDVWFTDPVFGKYHTLEELQELEIMAAEEETDEHMDATALSKTNELAALMEEPFVTEDKEGSNIPSLAVEAEHECEDGAAVTKRTPLPLIDLKVRS